MKVGVMATDQFTALSNAAKKVYECYCKGDTLRILLIIPNIILYARLAAPFNNLSSALAGAAATSQAQAEPFKASGAAAAFWSFSAAGKGLGPRP
jgi:hypothetical protein